MEPLVDPPVPSRDDLEAALPTFLGVIEQRPPAYSALKVGGKRAYRLARAGEQVELSPRQVRVDALAIRRYEYPELGLEIACGGGTYVRSLGRDLAEAVGTGAVMSHLCRTAVGGHTLDRAVGLDALEDGGLDHALLPASTAVADLPRLVLDGSEIANVRHGRFLDREAGRPGPEIAAFDEAGRLVAILVPDASGRLKPHRNFASSL